MSELVNEPRIVVGVDGSPESRDALRWALRIARNEHAAIDVVGAWESPPTVSWSGVPTDYRPEPEVEKEVNAVVDEVFGADRPSYVRVLIREGHAVRVLLHECTDALLLVVGSRGHGGYAGLLLGSVSARVAELAHCPVLVVHGDRDRSDDALPWRTT